MSPSALAQEPASELLSVAEDAKFFSFEDFDKLVVGYAGSKQIRTRLTFSFARAHWLLVCQPSDVRWLRSRRPGQRSEASPYLDSSSGRLARFRPLYRRKKSELLPAMSRILHSSRGINIRLGSMRLPDFEICRETQSGLMHCSPKCAKAVARSEFDLFARSRN